MDVVAEHRMQIKYAEGTAAPVLIRVGRPVRRPTGVWDCEAEIEGGRWAAGRSGAMGDTSWRALMAALRSLYWSLLMEVSSGAKLLDESGRYPVHLDEVFPFPREGERPPPR